MKQITLVKLLAFLIITQNLLARVDVKKINATDVINYADTATGIKYKLRTTNYKNRWQFNGTKSEIKEIVENTVKNGRIEEDSKRGDTDCSGLATHALRIFGYFKPNERRKRVSGEEFSTLTTWYLHEYAEEKKKGLFIAATGSKMRDSARHGDIINRVKNRGRNTWGHVFLYNGLTSSGKVSSVEARGSKYGVGRFARSWNDILKSGSNKPFKLIRSKMVYNNVSSRKKIIPASSVKAVATTYKKPEEARVSRPVRAIAAIYHKVKEGQNAFRIGLIYNINLKNMEKLNPGVDLRKIRLGQKLRVG